MRVFIGVITGMALSVSMAVAAPSKKAATAFVKEMEAAVKAGDMAIRDGSNQVLHDHSKRIAVLKNKATAMFVPAEPSGACNFAAGSANQLWVCKLKQFQNPTEVGYRFVKSATEDYRDNLGLCKQNIGTLK